MATFVFMIPDLFLRNTFEDRREEGASVEC